jgi:hypothetical protein
MDVEKLVKQLGGHYLSNKARVTVDGKEIVVGRITTGGYELTVEGDTLISELEEGVVEVTDKSVTKTRKKEKPLVE